MEENIKKRKVEGGIDRSHGKVDCVFITFDYRDEHFWVLFNQGTLKSMEIKPFDIPRKKRIGEFMKSIPKERCAYDLINEHDWDDKKVLPFLHSLGKELKRFAKFIEREEKYNYMYTPAALIDKYKEMFDPVESEDKVIAYFRERDAHKFTWKELRDDVGVKLDKEFIGELKKTQTRFAIDDDKLKKYFLAFTTDNLQKLQWLNHALVACRMDLNRHVNLTNTDLIIVETFVNSFCF